jgi:hypothetical protein
VYSAMRDCYMALYLDKSHLKSHFRLAKCLNDLKWYQEAKDCISVFCKKFPDYAKTQPCENLVKDIDQALSNQKMSECDEKVKKMIKKSKKLRRVTRVMPADTDEESDEEEESEHDVDDDETDSASDKEEEDMSRDEPREDEAKLDADKRSNKRSSNQSGGKRPSRDSRKLKLLAREYNRLKKNANDFRLRYCGHCNVATDIKEANFVGDNFIAAGSDDGSFFIWDKTTTNVVRVLKGDESIVNCIQPHPFSCYLATSGIDPHIRIWSPKLSETKENDERIVTDIRSAAVNNQIQMNSHPFEFLFLNLTQNNSKTTRRRFDSSYLLNFF